MNEGSRHPAKTRYPVDDEQGVERDERLQVLSGEGEHHRGREQAIEPGRDHQQGEPGGGQGRPRRVPVRPAEDRGAPDDPLQGLCTRGTSANGIRAARARAPYHDR